MDTITPIQNIQRTNGDGMENPDSTHSDLLINRTSQLSLSEKFIYRPNLLGSHSVTTCPTIPPGQMIHLKPQPMPLVSNRDVLPKNLKGKEPKFVPYEPYKAAVKPIVPSVKKNRKNAKQCDVTGDLTNSNSEVLCNSDISHESSELEKHSLIAEVEALKSQNQELEKQLKYQAQVNTDLKSMLVAAVGEDLESRVQHLTEDKLQLARALLSSAQNLSSHQEQLEWLVGQCEVWRSKFLSSSLMLEEVARSITVLRKKTRDLQDAIHDLLDERIPLHENMLDVLKNLQVLRENFDPASGLTLLTSPHRQQSPSSSSLTEVAEACQVLSECLAQRLLGTAAPSSLRHNSQVKDFTTPAERKAQNLLKSSTEILATIPDIACSAVVGAAAVAGGGIFPHISSTPTSCCAHCSGDMKTL